MIATIFGTLLAIIKAIPAVKGMIDEFISFYVQNELSNMKKENFDAIRKAMDEHDQRELEKSAGSPTAGLPSGDSGAVIQPLPPPNVLPKP